jgi:thioredoxin-related protein
METNVKHRIMRLKNYASAFIFIFILGSGFTLKDKSLDDTPINWTDIEQAQKLAKEAPKKVFIDFTAKWCGWCKVMDKKTFTDPEVADYMNKNYYAVKMNFDSKETFSYLGETYAAKQLAEKYGITGLPTMLLASADFKTIEQIVGYHKPNPFIKRLKAFNELY